MIESMSESFVPVVCRAMIPSQLTYVVLCTDHDVLVIDLHRILGDDDKFVKVSVMVNKVRIVNIVNRKNRKDDGLTLRALSQTNEKIFVTAAWN